jgi:SAM-dependent methyltransferase
MTWGGGDYQARFDALAASGQDVHGEAAFVDALRPASVLDAGCGTGRVAIELARRGLEVVGVDKDPSMLDVARQRVPELSWIEADLVELDLRRTFDVVVMAGNVLLFVVPGTQATVVARTAAHVEPGGALVAGFQLRLGGYDLAAFDEAGRAAGLVLEERFSTWERGTFKRGSDYAVSVLRRPLRDR